jgi:hypothetical protein
MLKKTQEKKKMGEWKDSSIQLKFQIKIYIWELKYLKLTKKTMEELS